MRITLKKAMCLVIYSIMVQVAQSRYQLMEYLTWKGGHNRRLFTIFRRLSSWQKKISFIWNCRISGSHVCWREAIQYRCIGSGIEYYVLSQSTYNCLTQGFQLPSIRTISKMKSRVNTVV